MSNIPQKSNPRIYYFTPDYNGASGGIKVIYRHVDILNQAGYEAYVIHSIKDFRCTWFANNTRIVYFDDIQWLKDDIIVIAEIFFHHGASPAFDWKDKIKRQLGKKTDHIPAKLIWQMPQRKIIFCQNSYSIFLDFTSQIQLSNELLSKVDSFFSISDQNTDYLRFSFPKKSIYRLHWSLNTTLFQPNFNKQKIISYMPRKNSDHSKQVIAMLKIRGKLSDYEFLPIEGKNESEVADILKKSAFFLSFGYPEGLPLPPAEAMACGCMVIGYNGGGGQEYFKEEFCFPIPMGDIISFATKVEELALGYAINPTSFLEMTQKASQYILQTYSPENEEKLLVETWKNLL